MKNTLNREFVRETEVCGPYITQDIRVNEEVMTHSLTLDAIA